MTTPTKEQPVSGAKDLVDFARELENVHGNRAIDGLFVQVRGPQMMQVIRTIRKAATLLERQEQAAGKLVEALEPFANIKILGDKFDDTRALAPCTIGDIRRAALALREYHEAHHGN